MVATPGLLIVYGSEGFQRRRFLRTFLAAQRKAGWSVESVDADSPRAVERALDGGILPGKKIVVVENPEKGSVPTYAAQAAEQNTDTVLVLHLEGEADGRTKFGKFLADNKKLTKHFPEPKEWDAAKMALDFVNAEIKTYGKSFGHPGLAEAIIERSGTDLGVLSFEILKIVMSADAQGATELLLEHAQGVVSDLMEASLLPITDALAVRNKRRLSKALSRVHRTSKHDPTMRVTRYLASQALKWFQASEMLNLGAPADEAAQELGLHPWFYKNKVLPVAKKWGRQDLIRLLRALAEAERGVLNGHVAPWVGFSASLLEVC